MKKIQRGIVYILSQIGLDIYRCFRGSPLLTTQEDPRSPIPHEPVPWLAPTDLAIIQQKNAHHFWCVSWVLKDITDPEALDAAIQLAGTILWFEGGINAVKPLYKQIISTFDTCFGSDKKLRPGLRNRAYYSGRAILWIHILALCKSNKADSTFPLPTRTCKGLLSDHDLEQLCSFFLPSSTILQIEPLLGSAGRKCSHSHLRWTSRALLHLSQAIHFRPGFHPFSVKDVLQGFNASTPLDVLFDLLLMCCNLLGSPVEEEVLKIHDKTYGVCGPYSPSYSYHCSLVIEWTR